MSIEKDVEIKDNWDVIGLRGTGSFDYAIHDVFVPEELTHLGEDREPIYGGCQYTVGFTGFTAWGHTAFALGVGRHALDEIKQLARTKQNVFGRIGDGASFQQRYARAEAMYRSAYVNFVTQSGRTWMRPSRVRKRPTWSKSACSD